MNGNAQASSSWRWSENGGRDVKILRSTLKDIPKQQRAEKNIPRRNFGDYDPIHPRLFPKKSTEKKSHLTVKEQERRVIYTGISENKVRLRYQLQEKYGFEN